MKNRITEIQKQLTSRQDERQFSKGLDCKFEKILRCHGICFTPYHSRTLTGVGCRRLMSCVDLIMDELTEANCQAAMRTHENHLEVCIPDENEVITVLEEN